MLYEVITRNMRRRVPEKSLGNNRSERQVERSGGTGDRRCQMHQMHALRDPLPGFLHQDLFV